MLRTRESETKRSSILLFLAPQCSVASRHKDSLEGTWSWSGAKELCTRTSLLRATLRRFPSLGPWRNRRNWPTRRRDSRLHPSTWPTAMTLNIFFVSPSRVLVPTFARSFSSAVRQCIAQEPPFAAAVYYVGRIVLSSFFAVWLWFAVPFVLGPDTLRSSETG